MAVHPPSMAVVLRSPRRAGSGQGIPRHTRGSADRCSLPGLAGLADSRRVGPSLHHHSSGLSPTRRHLGRGFSLAGADCEYRAPLPPRLARPHSITLAAPPAAPAAREWRRGRDLNPRYAFWTYTRFPVVPLRPLGHLSPALVARPVAKEWRRGWDSNPRADSSPSTRFRVEPGTTTSVPLPTSHPEERLHERTRLVGEHALGHRHPMVPRRLVEHSRVADDRPGLRVPARRTRARRPARARTRPRTSRTARRSRRASRRSAGSSPPGARRRAAPRISACAVGSDSAIGRLCPRPTRRRRGRRPHPPALPRRPPRRGPPRARPA